MSRDMTAVSYLPTLLAVRSDLETALNYVRAYEQACIRREWNGSDLAAKQASAVHAVQQRVRAAYDRLDLGPTAREAMAKEMRHLRTLADAQREEITRLMEENARLTAANVELVQRRAA